MQVADTTVFGTRQEAFKLLPADHMRGHPWHVAIERTLAVSLGESKGPGAPPAALLVGAERMPSGSLTHVRFSSGDSMFVLCSLVVPALAVTLRTRLGWRGSVRLCSAL